MINTLHLGLSYNCNMKCKHCFVNKQNDNLDIDTLKKTIDYLEERGLFFVIYTFGEPLLAKSLWDVSKYVVSKGLIQTLMTNGSLINEKTIIQLKKHKINNIYISLDSINKEKHDNNRNYKGAYEKAIKAIKLLVKNDFNVGIATTINDNNVLEMKELLSLAKSLKVNSISFLRERKSSILADINNIEYYNDFYKEYICSNKKINVLFHDPSLLKITKDLYEEGKIDINTYEKYYDMNSCHYSTTLSIEPNGNVKNCNLINNKIGNINETDIKSLLKEGSEKNECISCYTKFSK